MAGPSLPKVEWPVVAVLNTRSGARSAFGRVKGLGLLGTGEPISGRSEGRITNPRPSSGYNPRVSACRGGWEMVFGPKKKNG